MNGLDAIGNSLSALAKAERKERIIPIEWIDFPFLSTRDRIDFFFLSILGLVKVTPSMEEPALHDASEPLGPGFDWMAAIAMRAMVRHKRKD